MHLTYCDSIVCTWDTSGPNVAIQTDVEKSGYLRVKEKIW